MGGGGCLKARFSPFFLLRGGGGAGGSKGFVRSNLGGGWRDRLDKFGLGTECHKNNTQLSKKNFTCSSPCDETDGLLI